MATPSSRSLPIPRDDVAVATWSDDAVDHDPDFGMIREHFLEHRNGATVHVGEPLRRVTELRSPVGIRAPGRGVEHRSDALLACDRDVRFVVVADGPAAALVLEQDERCEGGEVQSLVEDQRRLHPPVGDEEAAFPLWQRHVSTS
jgi:hypothetical protein